MIANDLTEDIQMTDVLPDSETLTQPIAHRWIKSTTTYDPNATMIMRPGERLILADPNASGEIVPLGHLLDYTTAPTTPPPIPPRPSPTPPPKPTNGRPIFYQGERRRPLPRWAVAFAIVGLVLGAWTWGWMSHALVIGAFR